MMFTASSGRLLSSNSAPGSATDWAEFQSVGESRPAARRAHVQCGEPEDGAA